MQTQKYSIQQPLIESLYGAVQSMVFPTGVMEDRSGRIKGPGFFPGATGLAFGSKPLSSRPIMVLGQDQDNEEGHNKSEHEKSELYSKTWTHMKATFDDASIDLGDCFFTNFIMGVRVKSPRSTGPSPALRRPAFMQACCTFFIQQLEAQQPKVILCLGMVPFKLLSLVSSGLRIMSICVETFKDLDARGMNVIPDVEFDALPGKCFVVVPLCHPSYRLNGHKRFEKEGGSYSNEVALLKEVREKYLK